MKKIIIYLFYVLSISCVSAPNFDTVNKRVASPFYKGKIKINNKQKKWLLANGWKLPND